MKNILLFLLLSASIASFGQIKIELDETTRTIVQRQQMDRGFYYRLEKIETKRNYSPQYELLLLGKKDTVVSKTILNEHVYSMGNRIQALYMHFVSVNTGFIYGYEDGYGFFPMLYKTTDAGKTWNRTLFEEAESLCQIDEDDFYMFNQKQGIMIVNPTFFNEKAKVYNSQNFDYFITNDGGLTWKKKMVNLKSFDMLINNFPIQTIYRSGGTIISIVIDSNKTVVLRSDDFGENFKVLK